MDNAMWMIILGVALLLPALYFVYDTYLLWVFSLPDERGRFYVPLTVLLAMTGATLIGLGLGV